MGVARRGGRDLGGVLGCDGRLARHARRARPGAAPPVETAAVALPKAPEDVVDVVSTRCSMCHCARAGVGRDWRSAEGRAARHARSISPPSRRRSACRRCMTHAMPPNNLTEMTPQERADARALAVGVASSRKTERP